MDQVMNTCTGKLQCAIHSITATILLLGMNEIKCSGKPYGEETVLVTVNHLVWMYQTHTHHQLKPLPLP